MHYTEEQIAELELDRERLRDVLRALPGTASAWEWTPEGNRTLTPARNESLNGYTDEEWNSIPDLWLRIIHPEDRERVRTETAAIAASRARGTVRYRTIRKDGTVMWLEAHCIPVDATDGSGIALRGVTLDVSADEMARQEIARSEDRYRDLIEASHELICTHGLDGSLLSANPALSRATGYEVEELLQMKVPELLPPHLRADFHQDYIQRVVRDGEASGTMLVTTRDGRRRVWEYRNTLRTAGVPVPIVRGLARDVTEREDALRGLRRAEEHFRSLIENASDFIGIIGQDGRLTYASPSVERLLGYRIEETRETPFDALVHPDDAGAARRLIEDATRHGGVTAHVQLRLMHRNGSPRTFEIVARSFAEGHQVGGTIFSGRDVTHRLLLEAQLERAKRVASLGHVAATIAHEFNNVLMSISPFAELLHRGHAPDVAKIGDHIANAVARGKRITLDILRYTQPPEPAIRPIELDAWWDLFEPELSTVRKCGITVESELQHGHVVLADPTQLAQVMSNLVANARDAMPSGGTITVRAAAEPATATFTFGFVPNPDAYVHLTVADTGTGIAPEVLPHIFEPLFTSKRSNGTGLGLAVAHQAVTRNGGFIFVETTVGEGTTFHLFLPRGTAVPREVLPPRDATPRARKIVIVEDEPAIMEGISVLLESLGVEVHGTARGNDTPALVERIRPDLVVLDIGLPDVDGFVVGDYLRRNHPRLPVIFASGHGDRRKLAEDPFVGFLQKPFTFDAFIEVLTALEKRIATQLPDGALQYC